MGQNEKQVFSGESSTGLKPNDAGLLCYVGIWISGIVFLIIEKKNTLVRFHAMQSLVCFGILSILINIADIARGWAIWASHRGPFFPLEVATTAVFGIFIIGTSSDQSKQRFRTVFDVVSPHARVCSHL